MGKTVVIIYSMLLVVALASCTTDNYDKGEGPYSAMHSDFSELSTDANKQAVSFVTDDGDSYRLSTPLSAAWIATADTTYRTVIYYNKVEEGSAQVLQLSLVPTLIPTAPEEFECMPQDPVGFESIWLSRSKKYINVGLLLKNGRDEAGKEGVHIIGLVCDEVRQNADGTHTACYRLLHDQGDAPQYYTNRHYISILLPEERPDSVQLTIQTYDGVEVRTLSVS